MINVESARRSHRLPRWLRDNWELYWGAIPSSLDQGQRTKARAVVVLNDEDILGG